MVFENRGSVALISVHGDPAVEFGCEEAGGQNVYVRRVGEELADRGWTVDMFTRQSSPDQPEIVEHQPGCRTIRLTAGPKAFINRNQLFGYLPEFLTAFRQYQADNSIIYPLVHTNYWLSAWIGLQLKQSQVTRLVHNNHSLGAVKYQSSKTIPLIARTRLEIEKKCVETSDCIIATSPQEVEHIRSLVSTNGNIEIIPCGTDTQRFQATDQQSARQKLEISQASHLILYVGRFDPRKGIETLVRAVANPQVQRHQNVNLMIVGGSRSERKDNQEKNRIEAIVKQLGLQDRVTFAGQISHEFLPDYYAASDICVVPSLYEPFGLVPIEAMACGTPVIASAVGGLKYTVIDGETGLLVPPQQDEKLASAIDHLISNPARRQTMGRAGHQRVLAHFSWKGVANQLDQLYTTQLNHLYREFFPENSAS
ncbi:glycosyltransferase family 1 protein [Acaryochloris sp. CCMEE 5410]|uniref:glycosyltransferase family 4 protein n=1 Tax=Acaryochloris sp. CCMEE 5410 TaxID=310037 RepID=UPI0002483F76|nr:glycosyltransferase family 1 protein [Acaryochloris sp. CCMEE 5410]KAI9134421.1 glycosyltransferase family 1 protein [Acaryochloris sp. CCMEE 5410]